MNKVNKGLMVLGLLFIGLGIYFIVVALASKTWDQVQGQIISAKIPARLSNSGSATQRHLVYHIEVTYSYEVEGKTYTNSRFSTGTGNTVEGSFNKKAKAREWLKSSEYSKGKDVIVFVNPKDSKNSVLSSGINIGTVVPIFIGLLFFITGYLLQKIIPKTPD
jgi:hypothetical protein